MTKLSSNNKGTAAAMRAALAGALAVGVSSLIAGAASAAPDWAADLEKVEKCGGVAKAGKNDCGTKSHQCAGQSKTDNLSDEWVYTPIGVCDKLGGQVLKIKKL